MACGQPAVSVVKDVKIITAAHWLISKVTLIIRVRIENKTLKMGTWSPLVKLYLKNKENMKVQINIEEKHNVGCESVGREVQRLTEGWILKKSRKVLIHEPQPLKTPLNSSCKDN